MVTQVIGAGGAWQKIAEVELTTSATEISFTNLDGDADDVYMLCYKVYEAGGTATAIEIRFNNDTGTNYNWGSISQDETNVSGGSGSGDTFINVGVCEASQATTGLILIFAKSGAKRTAVGFSSGYDRTRVAGGDWTNTSDNITTITVRIPSGAGAGSKFILFKKA